MVFQNYALYSTMNVYENIAFPLKNRKVKKNVIKESVLKIATLLRIENILDKKISAISGAESIVRTAECVMCRSGIIE